MATLCYCLLPLSALLKEFFFERHTQYLIIHLILFNFYKKKNMKYLLGKSLNLLENNLVNVEGLIKKKN